MQSLFYRFNQNKLEHNKLQIQQIELLKSRDLNIADSSKAAKFLGEVNDF